ncbi:MAG TPA: ABC transporter permease [Caldilineae bacterium]|nr:ABC transporter permease [Caldilineae bacterium]
MLKFIIRRLLLAAPTVLGASMLSFLLLYALPGNPGQAILKEQTGYDPSLEEITFFLQKHGLDVSLVDLCLRWGKRLLHGDLGVSLRTGEPVLREFASKFPATLELAAAAMALAVQLAFPLGIISAIKRNTIWDHAGRLLALWGVSMPNFWLGLLLILLFSLKLGWLPCFGSETLAHLILPALTLGTGMAASLMRLVRASTLEVLHQDYIRTARAKGLRESSIIWKHVLKNALIPVVTVLGLQAGHLLAGTVVVETVFAWPGVGKFLIDSIYARDYPVIQGFVLIIALLFITINSVVDLVYTWLDPRIRYHSAEG